MAKIGFEAPPDLGEMIGMLNETGQFRLSLVSLDGTVLGHLKYTVRQNKYQPNRAGTFD